MFSQQVYAFREINLSTHYLFITSSKRCFDQINRLALQLFQKRDVTAFNEIYRKLCHSTQFAYIVVDCHVKSPQFMQIRTRIFPPEWPMVVYIPLGRRIESQGK